MGDLCRLSIVTFPLWFVRSVPWSRLLVSFFPCVSSSGQPSTWVLRTSPSSTLLLHLPARLTWPGSSPKLDRPIPSPDLTPLCGMSCLRYPCRPCWKGVGCRAIWPACCCGQLRAIHPQWGRFSGGRFHGRAQHGGRCSWACRHSPRGQPLPLCHQGAPPTAFVVKEEGKTYDPFDVLAFFATSCFADVRLGCPFLAENF